MPDSNPRPLPEKSGALPMSHHIYKLNLTVARGAVRNYSNRRDKCDRLTVTGSAGALVLLRYHQHSTDKKNVTEQTNLSEHIERNFFNFLIA